MGTGEAETATGGHEPSTQRDRLYMPFLSAASSVNLPPVSGSTGLAATTLRPDASAYTWEGESRKPVYFDSMRSRRVNVNGPIYAVEETAGPDRCVEECKRCGGRHGTRQCFRKRSYLAASRGLPPETWPVTSTNHPSTSRPPTGTVPTSGLQVLRPRTRPLTTTNIPDHWQFEEPRGTEDARTISATPAPLNAGSEAGDDTRNTSSDGDLDESSGHESGSLEFTRDFWDLSQPASQEMEVHTQAPSPENDEPAFSGFDEISFPPLLPPTALPPPPNLDEVPIVSCGRYVLPDTDLLSTDQHTFIEMQTAGAAPTGRRERSRSRSPLRDEDKSPGVPSSLPANLENKPRRFKAPACSSDSDAPPIAKSKKLNAPPTGKKNRLFAKASSLSFLLRVRFKTNTRAGAATRQHGPPSPLRFLAHAPLFLT
ncbi:hypothetical protein HPB51_002117 [Rhipicephalus microplus]|uniref:Uncharacterized protein n=1 Tax=Rhipicephalus microplus TaxID=6941 RepID=A0A9J6DEU6_RHIMP|nr:hypothetical protein HPB51_002117 [Rhipicephalus microplus]